MAYDVRAFHQVSSQNFAAQYPRLTSARYLKHGASSAAIMVDHVFYVHTHTHINLRNLDRLRHLSHWSVKHWIKYLNLTPGCLLKKLNYLKIGRKSKFGSFWFLGCYKCYLDVQYCTILAGIRAQFAFFRFTFLIHIHENEDIQQRWFLICCCGSRSDGA